MSTAISRMGIVGLICSIVGCSDVGHYQFNFAENSDADHHFGSEESRQVLIDRLTTWADSNGFSRAESDLHDQIFIYALRPDPGNPKHYARLTYELRDNPDSDQFWLHIYLKTDRWGDEEAHRIQQAITGKLHREFQGRFTNE